MKRWILIGGGLIILIIVVVFYFVLSSLDSLIIAAVEKYGSEITQTDVRLNEAEVSVTSGEGALRGLSVANPEGFKSENAFRLGEIGLKLDVGTVTADPIVIKEIVVSAPEVVYEVGPKGANLNTIHRNINAYTAKEKAEEKRAPDGDEKKEGRKLVIENLYIRKGNIDIRSTIGQERTMNTVLPDIHLTDIGKGKGGATAGEVTDKIFEAILQKVQSQVATGDPAKLLEAAKEQATGAQGTVEEKTKGAADAVKGLFGN